MWNAMLLMKSQSLGPAILLAFAVRYLQELAG